MQRPWDKEDNAKILEFVLRWLSPDSQLKLYDLDAAEPDVNEYNHLPDTEALAERLRSCLQEGEELPKDFTTLFDDTLYKVRPRTLGIKRRCRVRLNPNTSVDARGDITEYHTQEFSRTRQRFLIPNLISPRATTDRS